MKVPKICKDCGKELLSRESTRCQECYLKTIKGKNNPMYGKKRPDVAEYNRTYMRGTHRSKTTKRKLSLLKQGKKNPSYGKPSLAKKWGYYKEVFMRSSWEIRIAQLLDEAKIKWQYECKRFILKDLTYCPDFYLPKYNLWIEVKGWMSPKCKERIKQFRELYPDENLLIIDKFLYQKYCKNGGMR